MYSANPAPWCVCAGPRSSGDKPNGNDTSRDEAPLVAVTQTRVGGRIHDDQARTDEMRPVLGSALAAAVLGCLAASGCGQSDQPPTPATVSLAAAADTIDEANNSTVQVAVELDAPTAESVTVQLTFTGSATRGRDYAVSTDTIVVPPNSPSATAQIDVYRDFDPEGDETVTIGLAIVAGHANAGERSSVTLTILDGEAATVNKTPQEGAGPEFFLLPFFFGVSGDAVVLVVAAQNTSSDGTPALLVAEWSTDIGFAADVHLLGAIEILATVPDPFEFLFGGAHEFVLPLDQLAPNRSYFVRAYLGDEPPAARTGTAVTNVFIEGFATNAQGLVKVRCEAPERTPDPAGTDPLFAEQWHLSNTGQTAFSNRAGSAGADLRMTGAIGAGRNGAGVKLAVVDTGLEICHPDLAANTAGGGSFNFRADGTPGASRTDPFNHSILGDHGTSVAGVAAAAANNGFGGRGVAPDVALVGFNLGAAVGEDPEAALLRSLGGSDSDPDSASVDIFNMSFGTVVPSENPSPDFVRLVKMGTSELRSGRGALYVKAAGNGFGLCERPHPLNREVGCIGANTDPDQNLPWLLTLGAFNADDLKSSFSSAGANLWVVGPGGEDGLEQPAIITTDQAGAEVGFNLFSENPLTGAHPLNRDGDYVSAFGGTSSAAPAVAGAIAVLLGANPDLSWRDVKHILAVSARRIDPDRAEARAAFNGSPYVAQHAWQTNAAGYDFHNWYGFGAVDIDAALALAASYTPGSLGSFVESPWFELGADAESPLAVPDADGAGVTATMEVTGLPDAADIEAVVLEIAVEHTNAFDLGLTLRSPAGTASVVNPPFNTVLDGFRGLRDWELLSNAFYGENPNGAWNIHVADLAADDTGSLTGWRLRFYYGEHP